MTPTLRGTLRPGRIEEILKMPYERRMRWLRMLRFLMPRSEPKPVLTSYPKASWSDGALPRNGVYRGIR